MKKSLITLAVAAAVAVPMSASAAEKTEAKFYGYTQITAAIGKGQDGNSADGLRFGADSVRLGYKIKHDKVWGELQIDFNKSDNSGVGSTKIGVPEIIKDAVVGYKFSDAAKISVGVFKTPIGMDFSNASKQMDITKRGMDTGLVLERAAGLMISGRNIGGFGYDFGTFNPTQRTSAVNYGEAGDGAGYAGRVMYDMGDALHIEASYGTSTQDDGVVGEDYTVMALGGSYKMGDMTFKAEYIAGNDVRGQAGYDESVWYLHGGYAIHKKCEIVLRHYAATSKVGSGVETDLGNTYIGWNIHLAEKKKDARIQLNYVVASGDETTYSGYATGNYAYTDDVFLAQFQVGF